MNQADHEGLLRAYPVLRELPAALLGKAMGQAEAFHVPAGRCLFADGNPAASFPLLVDGIVRVSRTSPGGHEVLLYRLGPGESCALTVVALLGEGSYLAAGTAETEVRAIGIPGSVFLEMVLESAPFRAFAFGALSHRMAQLMSLVDDVVFRRVDQRLASLLLLHQQPIATTHQMLADELGTSREVISRILEALQQSGMIRLGRKRIEILDRNGLEGLRVASPKRPPDGARETS